LGCEEHFFLLYKAYPHTAYRVAVIGKFSVGFCAGSALKIAVTGNAEVSHCGGFAKLQLGIAVGVLMKAKESFELKYLLRA
jgi:hypothetical protein